MGRCYIQPLTKMGKGEGWGEGEGGGSGSNYVTWNHDLCSCCSGNMTHCLCGTFCHPCLSYLNADRLGENAIVYGVLGWLFPFVPPFVLRGKLREKHGISGSTMNDCCVGFCCACCANIQVANELDSRGAPA